MKTEETKKDNEGRFPLEQGIVLAPSDDQGEDYAHAQLLQTLATVTSAQLADHPEQTNKVENANIELAKSRECKMSTHNTPNSYSNS